METAVGQEYADFIVPNTECDYTQLLGLVYPNTDFSVLGSATKEAHLVWVYGMYLGPNEVLM